MDETTRRDVLSRLKRIEGQIRGLSRMVEDDKYCIDVLTQVSAAVAALEKVGLKMVNNHMRTCVRDAITQPGGDAGDRHIDELVSSLERFIKA
ncbi:MAG: metal-sensitive transcriptional regulator [Actinomycetota bacterium]